MLQVSVVLTVLTGISIHEFEDQNKVHIYMGDRGFTVVKVLCYKSEPSGPLQACNGIALPFIYIYIYIYIYIFLNS